MKIEVPPQPPPVAPLPVATAEAPRPPAPVAARPFACNGGVLHQTMPGRNLCAHTDALGWDDAEAKCVADGGHLLALEKDSDLRSAKLLLGSHLHGPDVEPGRAAWIGLEIADKKRRTWKWSDGDAVKAASWANGEPNNWDGNELCGEWLFATGTWNDTRCNLVQPFMCEGVKACPAGGTRIATDKDYCYLPTEAAFSDAKRTCQQLGGKLAMPKTSEAQTLLTKGAGQRFPVTAFWIGLNELSQAGTWLWTSGAPLADDMAGWKAGEPNGYLGREHCVEAFIDSWQWNDFDCSEKLPFVCQAPTRAK